jgi:hypothetical protein
MAVIGIGPSSLTGVHNCDQGSAKIMLNHQSDHFVVYAYQKTYLDQLYTCALIL